jgi:hypothetical protein
MEIVNGHDRVEELALERPVAGFRVYDSRLDTWRRRVGGKRARIAIDGEHACAPGREKHGMAAVSSREIEHTGPGRDESRVTHYPIRRGQV